MKVALVVIARDEAARIERLLRSIAPWVDRMCVLDTGSADDTAALAAACGAQVGSFAWCDDFSAARNAALDMARSDWHVVLDADEWLISGGEALAALRSADPAFVGGIELFDQFNDGQSRVAHTWLSRVLPGHVRYSGRIHEQPVHALRIQRLPVQIGHDGYLPDRLAQKRGRNRTLLQAEIEAQPTDSYLWYQLGKDAVIYEDLALSESAFERAAALPHPTSGWWLDLVARRLYALKCLKRHGAGMAFAQEQLAVCADSPDFFFALGDLLLDLAADEPVRASELLPMIEQAWRRCLEIGERPDLEGAVAGRGSHLAAHNLALVLEATGRAAQAAALRDSFSDQLAGRTTGRRWP